ncbi:MAG: rRNA methyltransferase [Desulfurococcales archaeon]|nr:rRNA methyltransferase [Desulfurococcales archaeon]
MRLRLVLVGVEGAVNLGFIARLTWNFDVDEWYLVSPKASIEEAERYAAKAAEALKSAVIVDSLGEALKGVELSACTSAIISEGNDVLRVPLTPAEFSELAVRRNGVVAVVMGRESTGLTREEIKQCDLLVSIPASSRYRALNLSNATAIILYELYKARAREPSERIEADRRTLELILEYVKRLSELVISDRNRAEEAIIAFRRILARCGLSAEEARRMLFLLSRAYRRVSA